LNAYKFFDLERVETKCESTTSFPELTEGADGKRLDIRSIDDADYKKAG
jgi:hypothetical protein